MTAEERCPGCGVEVGSEHEPACSVEECTCCYGQRFMCDCAGHDRKAAAWSGELPGVQECRERGWWCCLAPDGVGTRPATDDTPGATPDLTRRAVWKATGEDKLYA